MTVRWGLLGTADIGIVALNATRASATARFVAVGSRTPERARAFAAAHGIPEAFGSYAALLASDSIDAVYVALPVALHAEWTVRALEAGKHVLCEKPFVQRAEQAAAAFDAAERGGLFLAEALAYRLHPQTALARRLAADGTIGVVRHVRAALTVRPNAVDIRRQKATGGSALYDLGCYCVSAARLFGGTPLRVYADSTTDGGEVDYRTVGTMWHPGDVTAQFDVGFDMPRRDELEIIGSEGRLVVSDPWLCRSATLELHREGRGGEDLPIDPGGTPGLEHREGEMYRIEFELVSRAIESGERSLEFGRADAVDQARTLGALQASGERHVPISL